MGYTGFYEQKVEDIFSYDKYKLKGITGIEGIKNIELGGIGYDDIGYELGDKKTKLETKPENPNVVAFRQSPFIRNYSEIQELFKQTINYVASKHNVNFPLDNRIIKVVDSAMLLKEYGRNLNYSIGGFHRGCREKHDIFLLNEKRPWVLNTLFHEYGHSLNPYLGYGIEEEMKATAFSKAMIWETVEMKKNNRSKIYKELLGLEILEKGYWIQAYHSDNPIHKQAYENLDKLESQGAGLGEREQNISMFNMVCHGKNCNTFNPEIVKESEDVNWRNLLDT